MDWWSMLWETITGREFRDWLGVSAFFLAIANLLITRRKETREPIRTEILKNLAELQTAILQLSDDLEQHLCFEAGRKRKQEIYRAERRARTLSSALRAKLPACENEVFKNYTAWWESLSGDGFPVQFKKDAHMRTSQRVSEAAKATTVFVAYLEQLRMRCLYSEVAYWKLPSK